MQEILYLQKVLIANVEKLHQAIDKHHLDMQGWKRSGPSRMLLLAGWIGVKAHQHHDKSKGQKAKAHADEAHADGLKDNKEVRKKGRGPSHSRRGATPPDLIARSPLARTRRSRPPPLLDSSGVGCAAAPTEASAATVSRDRSC